MKTIKGNYEKVNTPKASGGCAVGLVIFLALPAAMIGIGGTYLHQCPVQYLIPIYLIVGGTFGLLIQIVGIIQGIKRSCSGETQDDKSTSCAAGLWTVFSSLAACFMFAWFVCGNVWVYSLHVSGKFHTDEPMDASYCHPTLYWFTFWIITVSYILLAAAVAIGVLVCCAAVLCACCCVTGGRGGVPISTDEQVPV